MGRPINKKYIGNTSQSGQQFQATAFFGGDNATRTAYIAKQTATNTYNMVSVDGQYSGSVQLVNGGVSLLPGQANISVTPYGSSGSGATVTANLGINTATVAVGGTGSQTTYYAPGQILFPTSGTSAPRGNVYVDTVTMGNVVVLAGGPGYTVGDKFTWAYAGYDTPAVVTVASVTGNGNISTATISTAGTVSNINVSNTTPFSGRTTANAWATGASFAVRWDVKGLSVVNNGDYTSAPSNPVALSGSATGTGASANIAWQVASVKVTNGGSNYAAVNVAFSGTGGASAIGKINAGSLSTVIVEAAGNGYTNIAPTVSVTPINTVEYAQEIRNRTVTTFSNNTWEWSMTGEPLTQSNQATIRSA